MNKEFILKMTIFHHHELESLIIAFCGLRNVFLQKRKIGHEKKLNSE